MRKYNFFKLITIELCRFHYILTTTIEALALALALAFFLVKMVEKGFGISVSVGFFLVKMVKRSITFMQLIFKILYMLY